MGGCSETGKGVDGAKIQAIGTSGVYTGRSGSGGRFTIRDLPNSDYTVVIDRDDYLRGVKASVRVPNRSSVNTEVQPTGIDFLFPYKDSGRKPLRCQSRFL
ncbi:MAG: carboxypeptidase-like regulatory domain-containing protein [bacterium]|nr:carboxypeptidase-like regulatory domain-containing protein [bacterium]